MPKLDEQDIKNGLVSIPGGGLRLAFSIVKVKRDDPAEAAFIAMLLASEEDLRGFNEPMAFPIFGQGRALYAVVGKGIRAETIDEAAPFLIGSCSCQVKEQNPGIDIAMAVDWKQMVKGQATPGQKLPELKDMADLLPQTVTIDEAKGRARTTFDVGLEAVRGRCRAGLWLADMETLLDKACVRASLRRHATHDPFHYPAAARATFRRGPRRGEKAHCQASEGLLREGRQGAE